MDRKWRKMRWVGGLITVGIAASVLLAGCPSPQAVAGGAGSSCQREYAGATGVDMPETSRLSCASINNLTSSSPSEPEAFLIRGDSPRLLWKCRFFGAEARRVVLRCEHDQRHFSIIKSVN